MLPIAAIAADHDSSRWEKYIARFEAADKKQMPEPGGVLFIGSSSIRMWKTLKQDFAGFSVINRGFGGSQIADSTHFAGRILHPYKPRQIVLYAGDNDVAAGKSPETVLADFQKFVKTVHAKLPEARISFIAIKPSLSRWKLSEKMAKANALVRGDCAKEQAARLHRHLAADAWRRRQAQAGSVPRRWPTPQRQGLRAVDFPREAALGQARVVFAVWQGGTLLLYWP